MLSMKPISSSEGALDLRSQPMRSKLLALYIISTILQSHMYVFSVRSKNIGAESQEPATFLDAVKENLFMTLTRNATSNAPPVFEVSMDIFGKMVCSLRPGLKREIAVFFTEIIIPTLEARKNVSWYQLFFMLESLHKIFANPENDAGKFLVEIYLNYDCDVDGAEKENIWERLIGALSRILSQHTDANHATDKALFTPISSYVQRGISDIPSLSTNNLQVLSKEQVRDLFQATGDMLELKKVGLELMVQGILRSLVVWLDMVKESKPSVTKPDTERVSESNEVQLSTEESVEQGNDVTKFESMKMKKQTILQGIKLFNTKPKKGFQFLIEKKCIDSREPDDVAHFLLNTEGLNKAMIGEFLGEFEPENISIMHSFVNQMNFAGLRFVEALRGFLQKFRLPGEAQKIDRFMLKFAERFLVGNPTAFSCADTAYILAYSVIMLNTDQHNAQVKNRMTKADFLKNNRGIDSGANIPDEILGTIFDEILSNEIVMKDEKPIVKPAESAPGPPELLFGKRAQLTGTGADVANANETMVIRLESILAEMYKIKSTSTNDQYFLAKRHEYLKGMYEITWMSILTGLSSPLQELDTHECTQLSLEGFSHAIHISCSFEMALETKAFLSTLFKFTLLNNYALMKPKNLAAVKTLIEISSHEGNRLQESWKEVIQCTSQLEKINILGGIAADDQSKGLKKKTFSDNVAADISSQSTTRMIDKLFTNSVKLSGSAILHFVRALCETSWDEISNPVDKDQPRMYCLQRLVEISYYNMKRIRVEWAAMWAILGDHFNRVGCYPNTTVVFFAIDKLRQLSLKFLEIEELSNFKFQKDFLHPFEEIIKTTSDPKIKDMCLTCITQIVLAKGSNIRSGWKTIFGCVVRQARDPLESLVNLAFELIKEVNKNHFITILNTGTFPDYVACLTAFAKNKKAQKISVQAVELFNTACTRINEFAREKKGRVLQASPSKFSLSEIALMEILKQEAGPDNDYAVKYWMPILFGLHDVIMTSDLENRTKYQVDNLGLFNFYLTR